MKKFLSIILSIAMLCTVCAFGSVTAFAADDLPITEDGGSKTHGVTATYEAPSPDTVYSVNVAWGSMEFTYKEATVGTWSPVRHAYTDPTEAGWSCEEDANKITVTNRSNTGIDAAFSYSNVAGISLTTSFTDSLGTAVTSLSMPTAEAYGEVEAGERAVSAYINITDGVIANTTPDNTKLGDITVTITDADA